MIRYSHTRDLNIEDVKQLYIDSTLSERRPITDHSRLEDMLTHATVLVTAWSDDTLIGICRGMSDFSYVTYISDLAVAKDFQRKGIGKQLLKEAHKKTGIQTKMVLLSAPDAHTYYKHLGFEPHPRAWVFPEGKLFS